MYYLFGYCSSIIILLYDLNSLVNTRQGIFQWISVLLKGGRYKTTLAAANGSTFYFDFAKKNLWAGVWKCENHSLILPFIALDGNIS